MAFGLSLVTRAMTGLNEVSLRQRKILAEFHGAPRRLLRLIVVSQSGIGFTQAGISHGKLRILGRSGLKTLLRLQIVSLTQQLQSLVVIAKRVDRIRRGFERLRLQFFHQIGRQREILADHPCQLIHCRGKSFWLAASAFTWTVRLCLRSCSVASMRICSPSLVYCPQTSVSALVNSATRPSVEESTIEFRRDSQIMENLLHAIRRNRAQVRRLSNISAQHVRQAGSQPIPRRVAGSILKRHHGQRQSRRRRFLCRGENSFPRNTYPHNRQHQHRDRPRQPAATESFVPRALRRMKAQRRGRAIALPCVQIAQHLCRSSGSADAGSRSRHLLTMPLSACGIVLS